MFNKEDLYQKMVLIRYFEERIFKLFAQGELFGTTHCYIGQEANAVAVIGHLTERDIIVSNHRCHGHYLVRTDDVVGLMAELMGKKSGVCGGRGGSQHLCKDNFYTNGVQGNMVPVAAGMAYAEKVKRSGAIVVLFIGDGTFGQGVLYETFNIISLWKIPLLIIVENNRYAQTTPLKLNFAGNFMDRAKAFDLSVGELESNDVMVLYDKFSKLIPIMREMNSPHVEILHTYRQCPHSKGDDYRNPAEIEMWKDKDPLKILGASLEPGTRQKIEIEIQKQIDAAELNAREMPFATLD